MGVADITVLLPAVAAIAGAGLVLLRARRARISELADGVHELR